MTHGLAMDYNSTLPLYGAGAPATTPQFIGQTYVNTTNGDIYQSVGTSGTYNWGLTGKGALSAFTKDTVPNIFAWWDAGYGITKDGGNAVSSWVDKVSGWAVTQGAAANQPIYTASAYNGQPGLVFDGSNDFLLYDHTSTGNAFTVFLVASINQTYTDIRVPAYHGPYSHILVNNNPSQFTVGTSNYTQLGTYSTSTLYLVKMRVTGAAGTMYGQINGGAETSATTGYTSAVDATCFGALYNGSYPTKCTIMESIIYNASLTEENSAIVKAYLNNKYAIY